MTNAGGAAVSASIRVVVSAAKIIAQPAPARVLVGQAASLTVAVVGTAQSTVEWLRDGSVVSSSTITSGNATLSITRWDSERACVKVSAHTRV